MNIRSLNRRTLALVGVLVPLLALFLYVGLRSGPLAPVSVTVTRVESHALAPALFGIGTVEARYSYKIGPTAPARIRLVTVQVGESVRAGQLLGEMDPVDLDERLTGQDAALNRAEAAVSAAAAQVRESSARFAYADAQSKRYETLVQDGSVSLESFEAKQQERNVAEASQAAARANLDAMRQESARVHTDREGLKVQRASLRLLAPVDGLVVARNEDPGTTVVAGQAIVELIDPLSLWINVRFNQLGSTGLRAGLTARIILRSRTSDVITGQVLRVEPMADAVTEESRAKIVFDSVPAPLPPVGELAEVTVALPELPATPVVPNASLQRVDGRLGVWLVEGRSLRFAPVKRGASDLDGRVQILDGLKIGDRVVVYSHHALNARSRIRLVERLPGVTS